MIGLCTCGHAHTRHHSQGDHHCCLPLCTCTAFKEAPAARVYVTPGAFDALEERVARLERPVYDRDAIAWEIGRAAGLRGDPVESNPFRKASQ